MYILSLYGLWCVAVSASLGRDSSLVAADHMFLIDLSATPDIP